MREYPIAVLVSPGFLELLKGEWSDPVQVQIQETPGFGTGWELICRTYPLPGQADGGPRG